MDSQNLIILVVIFFLLGCQFSCGGLQKEHFGHNDSANCKNVNASQCQLFQSMNRTSFPAYTHCCNGGVAKKITGCDNQTAIYQGKKESCSDCIGIKAGEQYANECYDSCKCYVAPKDK